MDHGDRHGRLLRMTVDEEGVRWGIAEKTKTEQWLHVQKGDERVE